MEKQSYELIEAVSKQAKVHLLVYRKGEESLLKFFWNLNGNILKMLKAHPGIQLIHFNDGLIASIALFHSGYQHIKRVVTVHGLDVVFPLPYFQKKILPRFNQYDQIIAVSSATAAAIIERGVAKEKVKVIKNGVDRQIANSGIRALTDLLPYYPDLDPHKKYFVTLGRPVKRKGFSWLLQDVIPYLAQDFQVLMIGPFNKKASFMERALQVLPKKLYHLFTLFLGYPSDERKIRELLKDPQISNKVHHLGKVPFSHLQAILSHATAFLMPNIQITGDMEGFGLVCLEASLSGTLVVASDLEGIRDAIVDQKNGILMPSADSDAWINRLDEILAFSEEYKKDAIVFQSYSKENYGWEIMASEYLRVFEQLAYPKSALTLLNSKDR